MPSFSIPLSGLDTSSTALSVIANNLANLNTVGFKGQRAMFQDLFYQQIGTSGDGNAVQVGVGSAVAGIGSQLTQGSIQTTGVSTDVGIQGSGYFVVNKDGAEFYTRAGNFSVGSDGSLMTKDGAYVQGYTAVNGVIPANATLGNILIPTGMVNPPKATSQVEITMNLDASGPTTWSTPVVVHDALGASHVLTFTFTKTAANSWDYDISIPASDLAAGGSSVFESGQLAFDGTGKLQTPATNVTGIAVPTLANGAAALTFDWNLYNANNVGLVTQTASASTASATQQDGYASGSLLSFTIGGDGVVQGIFSNGQTSPMGQIALASFTNEQGLIRNGSNEFLASLASGAANVGQPGTGGRGSLSGGALEQANVDIATQFAQLIVAERSYQANAKTVTTFDEVTQTAINLKQ